MSLTRLELNKMANAVISSVKNFADNIGTVVNDLNVIETDFGVIKRNIEGNILAEDIVLFSSEKIEGFLKSVADTVSSANAIIAKVTFSCNSYIRSLEDNYNLEHPDEEKLVLPRVGINSVNGVSRISNVKVMVNPNANAAEKSKNEEPTVGDIVDNGSIVSGVGLASVITKINSVSSTFSNIVSTASTNTVEEEKTDTSDADNQPKTSTSDSHEINHNLGEITKNNPPMFSNKLNASADPGSSDISTESSIPGDEKIIDDTRRTDGIYQFHSNEELYSYLDNALKNNLSGKFNSFKVPGWSGYVRQFLTNNGLDQYLNGIVVYNKQVLGITKDRQIIPLDNNASLFELGDKIKDYFNA